MIIHNHIISNMPRGKNAPIILPPDYEEVELTFRTVAVRDSISNVPSVSYWGEYDPLYFIGNSTGMTTALRWQLTGVPAGSIINDARITLWAMSAQGDNSDAWATIGAEQVDNASQLTSGANHESRKTNLDETVQYGPHTGLSQYGEFISPNLKDVVQQVVNRSGWAGGNFIQFFAVPNPSTLSDYQYSSYWNANASYYPRLTLTIERPL